jgi:hypothetical protein
MRALLSLPAERAELSSRIQKSKLERCPIPRLRLPDAQWLKPQFATASFGDKLRPPRHREGIYITKADLEPVRLPLIILVVSTCFHGRPR